jgi:hypothetical protein
MKINLLDNTGVWTDVIKRRKSLDLAVETRYFPNTRLMKYLGEEIVSSVKGSRRHTFGFTRRNGVVVVNRFSNGTYPYGILKRTSPTGEPWPDLNSSTLRHRKYKGVKRGPQFILRETGKKIFEGVHVKDITIGRKRARVDVGWDYEGEVLVNMFMTGFNPIDTPWYGQDAPDGFADVFVEPRPVRGLQPALLDVLHKAMIEFLRA